MANKRALISVTDKSGIVEFGKSLVELGFEIISTGNTHKMLKEAGVEAITIDELTGFPEILDGRVKTLNPYVHGGILYRRDVQEHVDTVEKLSIKPIDMVVVNLYNFEGCLRSGAPMEEMIENIDIGGPSMIRSAAKNYKDVIVVTDPLDYDGIIEKLKGGGLSQEDRLMLSYKAFSLTGHYDSIISNYFMDVVGDRYPRYFNMSFEREDELRYGENPHQAAGLYKESYIQSTKLDFEQLHGKQLSFNNINDLNAALEILAEFEGEAGVASVAIKHANPCSAAVGADAFESFKKTYEADRVSIFGGIVGINSVVDGKTAEVLSEIFLEIIAAYDFTPDAMEILTKKKNLRILKLKSLTPKTRGYDMKYLDGKLLVQDKDQALFDKVETVTKAEPSKAQMDDMMFGMKIVKHMKSNAIAIVKDGTTLALGPGQTSRIWALENAVANNEGKSLEGSVLASDAFFPFDDCVKFAAKNGVKAIVQPGGSVNDKDSIKACDELGIAMVFTGIRHFKH